LGTTFIKLGQILSTRHDLLSPDLIHELEKLQDEVPAFPFETAKNIIETELKGDLEEFYSFFDCEPLAAASIGQVYRAVLINGRQVVVKICRPDINKEAEADLKILYRIARFLEKRISWAQNGAFVELIAEFERTIKEEMDFTFEGRNASKFKRNFASDPEVLIPAVYWQFTTSKILTLEYLNGIKFNDLEEIERSGFARMELAIKLVQALFKQIMMEVVFKYRVRLLPEFIMLTKSLMTLEGVVQKLAPGLNIVSMAEPFARKLVAERYFRKDLPEKAGKTLLDLGEAIYKFPKRIEQILENLAQGEVKINLKVDHYYPNEKNLPSSTNALINQLWVIIAILLISSVLLALNGTFFLGGFPVVKTGFIAAGFILVFLALYILRK